VINFIPAEYRLLALLVALFALAGASAAGGAVVATWKAEASCAESKQELADQVATLTAETVALKDAIATANHALELAKAKSDEIEAVQVEAVKLAALQAKSSADRLDRLKAEYANATSCNGVLKSYWNERK
jgi:Flp pilus assembly pilin Flp